jgi:hypothetical protein
MRTRSFSPKGIENTGHRERLLKIFAMICDVHERINREFEIIPGMDGKLLSG